MLTINAQLIKAESGYQLVVRVVTKNETEVAHTKFLELAPDLIESAIMLRNPFEVEFDSIEDVFGTAKAIETVKGQSLDAKDKEIEIEAEITDVAEMGAN